MSRKLAAVGGKQRTTVIKETLPAAELGDELTRDDFDIAEFLDDLGPTVATVDIQRLADDGQRVHVNRVPIDVLRDDPYKYIRENHGGGKYLLYVKDSEGKFVSARRIALEGPKPNGTPAAAAPIATTNDAHLQFMREEMARQQTLIMTLIQSLGNNSGAKVSSPLELAQALKDLHSVSGNNDKNFDVFLKGVEMGKDLGGNNAVDWKSEILRTVRDALPAVAPFLARAANPSISAVLPASVAEAPDALLRKGIDFLKKKALSGVPPTFICDWVIANANEQEYQPLLRLVLGQEFADFAKLDPEIEQPPFREYFLTIYNGLRSWANGSDNVDDDPGGAGGDAGNPSSNGSTGKGRSA